MLPPSDNVVEYTRSSMYRIEDSKIAEIWETRNTLGIIGHINLDMNNGKHSN